MLTTRREIKRGGLRLFFYSLCTICTLRGVFAPVFMGMTFAKPRLD